MALHKIKDFDPDYRDHFDQQDIQGFDLYSGDEKVGSVSNLLVDDDGNFRYLAINTGAWIFGKQVLLPIGRSRIDYNAKRVYVDGLSRRQVEDLPEYNENVDYDHESKLEACIVQWMPRSVILRLATSLTIATLMTTVKTRRCMT